MELRDVLNKMIQDNLKSSQPADLRVGTVTGVSPLEITINTAMASLRESILYLTSAVIEKKIQGTTPCIENGEQLPVEDGYTILNRGLKVGDIVLLLRVQRGQKYIVLSRVFGGG